MEPLYSRDRGETFHCSLIEGFGSPICFVHHREVVLSRVKVPVCYGFCIVSFIEISKSEQHIQMKEKDHDARYLVGAA